jgi:hypothetical protein
MYSYPLSTFPVDGGSSVLAWLGLYVASVPNLSGRFAFNQGGSHTIKAASLIVFKVTLKYFVSQILFLQRSKIRYTTIVKQKRKDSRGE